VLLAAPNPSAGVLLKLNAVVLLAPNAGVLVVAPKAGVLVVAPKPVAADAAGAPNAGVLLAPKAGVLLAAPNAGVLVGPKENPVLAWGCPNMTSGADTVSPRLQQALVLTVHRLINSQIRSLSVSTSVVRTSCTRVS
jgi:hypothetical protein